MSRSYFNFKDYKNPGSISRDACRISLDTILFAGVKYVTHKISDNSMFQNVNAGDIIKFIISDGLYYVLLRNNIAYWFSSSSTLSFFLGKYTSIILAVGAMDIITGSKSRMISNLINIGLSGGVRFLFEKITGIEEDLPSIPLRTPMATSMPTG